MVMGCTLRVPTLTGEADVNIKPCTQPDKPRIRETRRVGESEKDRVGRGRGRKRGGGRRREGRGGRNREE